MYCSLSFKFSFDYMLYRIAMIILFMNFVLVFYTQYLEFQLYLDQQSSYSTDNYGVKTNANILDDMINNIRYDVWNLEFHFPSFNEKKTNHVNYINFLMKPDILSHDFNKITAHRKPVVIANSSVYTWRALDWDLWNMSIHSSWKHLENVLLFPMKNESYFKKSISADDILYIHNQDSINSSRRHSSISNQKYISLLPSHLSATISTPYLVSSLLFIDFLYSVANNKLLHRYIYSVDYKTLESKLKLQHDTSWEEFRIRDNTTFLIDLVNIQKASSLASSDTNITAAAAMKNKGSKNHSDSHFATAEDDEDDFRISVNPFLNILYPGVAMQGRYSTYHTMRIQMKGKTRYHLIPIYYGSSKGDNKFNHRNQIISLFPSIHKYAYQAQTTLAEIFMDTNKSSALYSTLLHPGEVLYIPPYWLVYTEAVSLSMSLDVLSVSKEQGALSPAFHMALPFKKEFIQTKAQRIVSSQVFLVHVLSRIEGITSILKYSRRLYDTRYKSIYPENGLFLQQSEFLCLRDQSELYNSIINKLGKIEIINAATFIANQLNSNIVGTGTVTISKQKNLAADTAADPNANVKWTWLDDYVEQIASWAMGDANEAVLFIKKCLYMDSILEIVEEELGPEKVVFEPI